ncbi:TMEM175 family protein [Caenimonas koreensis]|uniref:DUF1211 domain-containing protein n=1 Tax=Caenimonas koreensis DSM 17982 TaxID=1121255 RepID=A0A844BCN0_9BURK|nr:TMEM175 family protein [Caenimonas koreensis]MRD48261.1 DUF1211 domain-containing protein [Caenimonas koreensis DSM 17982]
MHKHRLDALTDGIFAVAMTLLVIDLKLPETAAHMTTEAILQGLADLLPKLISWVISFLVLALFWWGHSRAFHYVRQIDGKLVLINLLFLGAASFMPFASSLSGGHGSHFPAQVVYSATMALNALAALALWRYVFRHPELCEPAMPLDAYRAAKLRIGLLIFISILACVIAWWIPAAGNTAFMLMMLTRPLSRLLLGKQAPLVA